MADSTAQIVIGGIYALTAATGLVAYLPCLKVMYSDKELMANSCFKLMFAMGICDLVSLVVHLITGIGTIFGWFLQDSIRGLTYIFGAILMLFAWYSYLALVLLIAINRCMQMTVPNFATKFFSSRGTKLWIGICFGYALCWFVLFLSPLIRIEYMPDLGFAWHMDLNRSALATPIKTFSWFQNNLIFAITIICYIVIFIRMKNSPDRTSHSGKHELRLVKQAAIICLVPIVSDSYFHTVGWVGSTLRFAYPLAIGQFLWILVAGSNPFVYLALNQTIRAGVMEYLGVGTKQKSTNITLTNHPKSPHQLPEVQ